MEKVFISYSHADRDIKDQVEKHLKVAKHNFKTWCDADISPGTDWFPEIEKNLNEAKVIIMLISADFLSSEFINREEIPRILEKRQDDGSIVIPLLIRPCAFESHERLKDVQIKSADGKALIEMDEPEQDKILARMANEINDILNPGKHPPIDMAPILPSPQKARQIDITRMPSPLSSYFFGRDRQREALDAAWEDEKIKIVIFKAWGGAGKTSLINKWLDDMRAKAYRDAEIVYAWSFYSQDTDVKMPTSADNFFHETLRWLGDESSSRSEPREKADRLVELIGRKKTLLILDGVETLQYSPGESKKNKGKFKNTVMRNFLIGLIDHLNGLCIITSREDIPDLFQFAGAVEKIKLERLSGEAGTQFLEALDVKGRKDEIKKAVEEYRGHALSLLLLGTYVSTILDGDIRKRYEIPGLTHTTGEGESAKGVIGAYENRFANTLELNILKIMGLFDRPVDMEVIDSLKNGKAIVGITDRLKGSVKDELRYSVSRLQEAGLLGKEKGADKNKLDCHPLVREYFRDKLKADYPGGWKEANKQLYEYYKGVPAKYLPETLEDMEPLYQAVTYGTRAGLYKEVLTHVYYEKILRGDEYYSTDKLAAYETDLSAVTNFFKHPWKEVVPELSENERAWVFSLAAFRLRALGILSEAIAPMEEALNTCINNEDWNNASINAINLSELLLILGKVASAVKYGLYGSYYADWTKDKVAKIHSLTTIADALHQKGQIDEAEGKFREAEKLQSERYDSKDDVSRNLYGVNGFHYCDLLLGKRQFDAVIARAEETIKIAKENKWRLEVGLDYLTLGHAWMLKIADQKVGVFKTAMEYLDQAVLNIQASGRQYYVPRCLLGRAACYRLQAKYEKARADLSEAKEIIDAGDMKLYLCDYHLEAGRLCKLEKKTGESIEHFKEAETLISHIRYLRRQPEIEEISNNKRV